MEIGPGPLSPRTARWLTEQLRKIDRLQTIQAVPPLTVSNRNGIPTVMSNVPTRKLIRLTGKEASTDHDSAGEDSPDPDDYNDNYETCKYSWVEVDINPDTCGYVDIAGSRGWTDIFPAVEVNGKEDVAATLPGGAIVEAWLAPSGSHWRFVAPGATGDILEADIVTCIELVSVDSLG